MLKSCLVPCAARVFDDARSVDSSEKAVVLDICNRKSVVMQTKREAGQSTLLVLVPLVKTNATVVAEL